MITITITWKSVIDYNRTQLRLPQPWYTVVLPVQGVSRGCGPTPEQACGQTIIQTKKSILSFNNVG